MLYCYVYVYLYTAELFPTPVRNQAVGFCALTAKLGGMTTMLLDLLRVSNTSLSWAG